MNKIAYNNCFGGFELSEAAKVWLMDRGKTEEWCNSCESNYHYRYDPLLIECIETLGQEKASGDFALLAIKEIEDDFFYIDEYDGSETVVTPNEVGWICIK